MKVVVIRKKGEIISIWNTYEDGAKATRKAASLNRISSRARAFNHSYGLSFEVVAAEYSPDPILLDGHLWHVKIEELLGGKG